MHPSAHLSPQPKWQIDWFSHFLHSSWQKVPILYNGCPYPPELPLPMGGLDPHLTQFLGPMRAKNPNGTSIVSAVFAQMTAECPYTLEWFACSLSKLPLPMGDWTPCNTPWRIWTPCNTRFLGPTRVLNPNGNSIVSAIFAGLTSGVTDTPIDKPRYSVGNNGPQVHT